MRKIAFTITKYKSDKIIGIPLCIGYLISYLKKHLPELECEYFDNEIDIVKFQPDMVCISSTSQVIDKAIGIVKSIKKIDKRIIFVLGGYHISALPYHFPTCFDFGIVGEGEQTLKCLIETKTWEFLRGYVFNKERILISNIDELPHPYRGDCTGLKEVPMFTSRGCLYSCRFCASAQHWNQILRSHSAEYVVDEIEQIYKEHGVKRFYLYDDIFAFNKRRLEEMVLKLEKRNLLGKVSFRGFVRANIFDEDVAQILKQMNFSSVRFGVESGSQKILSYLKKDTVTVEENQKVIDICSKYGISVGISLVFGSPGENIQDLMDTYEFIRRNRHKSHISGFYLLIPYPGTELWNYAIEKKLINDVANFDWKKLTLDMCKPEFDLDNAILLNKDSISKEEFSKFLKTVRSQFIGL